MRGAAIHWAAAMDTPMATKRKMGALSWMDILIRQHTRVTKGVYLQPESVVKFIAPLWSVTEADTPAKKKRSVVPTEAVFWIIDGIHRIAVRNNVKPKKDRGQEVVFSEEGSKCIRALHKAPAPPRTTRIIEIAVSI